MSIEQFNAIQLNQIRLDSCKKHQFEVLNVNLTPVETVTCEACKGAMNILKASEYVRGYAASGKDPNDIWDEWCDWHDENPEVVCPECLGEGEVLYKLHEILTCKLCDGFKVVVASKAREYLKWIDKVK